MASAMEMLRSRRSWVPPSSSGLACSAISFPSYAADGPSGMSHFPFRHRELREG
jgi:hypothetical protein